MSRPISLRDGASYLDAVFRRYTTGLMACFDLLCYQRASRSRENDLAIRKPTIICMRVRTVSGKLYQSITIEHQHSCNESLAQSCWQSDQGVFKETVFDDVVLIVSLRFVDRIIPMLDFERVILELHRRGLQIIRLSNKWRASTYRSVME